MVHTTKDEYLFITYYRFVRNRANRMREDIARSEIFNCHFICFKRTYGLSQSVLSPDRHFLYTQRSFDPGIADYKIFRQFAQPLYIQRQMQQGADTGAHLHQSFVEFPDGCVFSRNFTDQPDQFIGRDRFVISHMVNGGGNIPVQKLFYYITDIIYRSKRTAILKITQRPGNAFFLPHCTVG